MNDQPQLGPLFVSETLYFEKFGAGYSGITIYDAGLTLVGLALRDEDGSPSIKEQQAYAWLFAAAPSLFAVAEAALPVLRRQYLNLAEKYAGTEYEHDPAYVEIEKRYRDTVAAIAKAKGGTP